MKNPLLQQYLNNIKNMDDKEYLMGIISYNIAPTLIGHKPSTIVTLNYNKRNLNLLWEKYKEHFKELCRINFYEIKRKENSITVLFYDKNQLSKVIFTHKNMNFLRNFGYDENFTLEQALKFLKYRFQSLCPHEMGIFLGFPLEDVIAFMEYPTRQCLLCGYWKVYSNLKWAKHQFSTYDQDKYNIINSVMNGVLPSSLLTNNEI